MKYLFLFFVVFVFLFCFTAIAFVKEKPTTDVKIIVKDMLFQPRSFVFVMLQNNQKIFFLYQ